MAAYICIDLKSFYASVECMARDLDPMKAYLVVADESRTDKTICLAVSPALKAYGIPGRPRLFEVKQKLREIKYKTGKTIDLVIAPPRMAKYIEVSSAIYEVYLKYISKQDIHVYSIDEVFIDCTKYLKLYHTTPSELAKRMIKDVYEKTGITATAGIGTNLFLAKIAMDILAKHAKPNAYGVRMAYLEEMRYKKLLWDHRPLTDFWRVGKGIANKLEHKGMFTMGDVARMSLVNEDLLFDLFGVDAEILIDHAWGLETCTMRDIKNFKPDNHSLGSGQVLMSPYPYEKGKIIIKEMTEDLLANLIDQKKVTDAITLHIAYDRESIDKGTYHGETKVDFYGRVVPKSAHGTMRLGSFTTSRKKIMEASLSLYAKIVDHSLTIRKVTITFLNVKDRKNTYEQLDLFHNVEEEEHDDRLENVLINIKKKYGKDAVIRGTDLEEGATTLERNHQIGGHKA